MSEQEEHYPGETVLVFGQECKLVGRSGTQGWWVQFPGNVSQMRRVENFEVHSLPPARKAEEAFNDWEPEKDADLKAAFIAGFEAGQQ